jgi:ATP-dependent DNA helicase RecG
MSRAQLQQTLGLAHRDHFTQAYLAPALAAGWVAMTLPDKPKSRLQKYQLTAQGWALLKTMAL